MDIVEDARFLTAVTHFNAHDFVEAADAFEELYFEYTLGERELARALMQVAVGCHHLSVRQWRAGRERMEEGLRALTDQRFAALRTDCSRLLDSVGGLQAGERAAWPRMQIPSRS